MELKGEQEESRRRLIVAQTKVSEEGAFDIGVVQRTSKIFSAALITYEQDGPAFF